MRVILPHDIDLQSTNVTANSETEWSALTTYGLGDLVKVTTAFPHIVYKSSRGNNTNRPPATSLTPQIEVGTSTTSIVVETGAKTITLETNLGFSPGMIVDIAMTITPKSVNLSGEVTSYTPGTGVMEVMVTSVTGEGTFATWTISSEDEIGFWEEVGATNQHKMFDGFVNTSTVFLDEIFVKVKTTRADYVTLFGLKGKQIEFFLWDAAETTLLWSESVNLVYGSSAIAGITDWFEYFFGEFSLREDSGMDLGALLYEGVLGIKITATDIGENAECAGMIVGRAHNLGITIYGASAGIVDFSRKTTDDLGRTTITAGYWAKKNTLQLVIPNHLVDSVYKVLASLRGKPTAWIGNNPGTAFEPLVVYGIFTNFNIVFSGPRRSGCEIEIEGLI